MLIPSIVFYMYILLCIAAAIAIFQLFRTMRNMIRSRKGKAAICLIAVLLTVCIFGGGLLLFDLPCLVTGELETATGRVVDHDSSGREDVAESRGIAIETDSGERIKLTTYDTPIYKDEYLEIAYLPHTHLGVIVERITE